MSGRLEDLGFGDVKQGASDRTGMRVHWNSGSAEDEEVKSAVASMLDQELTADEAAQIALLNNHDLHTEHGVPQQASLHDVRLREVEFFVHGEIRFATSGGGTGSMVTEGNTLRGPMSGLRADAKRST